MGLKLRKLRKIQINEIEIAKPIVLSGALGYFIFLICGETI